jgi:hypothetical protein
VKLTSHLPLVQSWWSYTFTPPYAFKPWCLINLRETLCLLVYKYMDVQKSICFLTHFFGALHILTLPSVTQITGYVMFSNYMFQPLFCFPNACYVFRPLYDLIILMAPGEPNAVQTIKRFFVLYNNFNLFLISFRFKL